MREPREPMLPSPGLGHAGHGDNEHACQGERKASTAESACRLAFGLTIPPVGRRLLHQMFFPEIRFGWAALLFLLPPRSLMIEGRDSGETA